MNFQKIFFQKKEDLDKRLLEILNSKKKEFTSVSPFGPDYLQKIKKFTVSGKSLRGNCFLISSEIFGSTNKNLLDIAVSLEIIHSSLLIHDDIMDHDLQRRGQPTIFAQYHSENLAICAGDIGFLLAFEIISKTNLPFSIKEQLITKVSQEIELVCLGQMDDLDFGTGKKEISSQKILNMYLYKTARYSFSLPFILGGLVNGLDNIILSQLEKLGEYLGLIFQIRDDEMGFFSDSKTIGKPVGSDIRENKKTLLRSLLFAQSNSQDKKYLETKFGLSGLTKKDLEKIKIIAKKYKIEEQLDTMIKNYAKKSQKIISALPINKEGQNFYFSLLDFLIKRIK